MRNMRIVNVIPNDHSNETNDDAEPSVTVNPSNIDEIVVTAFTPTEGGNPNGPLFVSTDGGENWIIRFDIPGGETHDQSPLSGGTSGSALHGDAARRHGRPQRPAHRRSVGRHGRPHRDRDRRSISRGSRRGGPRRIRRRAGAAVRRVQPQRHRQVRDGGRVPRRARRPRHRSIASQLDPRNPSPNDGYEIRPTAHADGTVYVAYKSRSSFVGQNSVTDIVVARDDNWGSGSSPFTDLKDPDGKAGRLVATDVPISEVNDLGGIRLNNDLNIAVDPATAASSTSSGATTPGRTTRYACAARSIAGRTGPAICLTAENAALATMTINRRGMVGLLYQQLVGGRMETHFRTTIDGTNWDDTILARTDPARLHR